MPSYFVRTAAKAGISAGPITAIFDELRAQVPAAVDQAAALLPKEFLAEVGNTSATGLGNACTGYKKREAEVRATTTQPAPQGVPVRVTIDRRGYG